MDLRPQVLQGHQWDFMLGAFTVQASIHGSDTFFVNILSLIFLGNTAIAKYNLFLFSW